MSEQNERADYQIGTSDGAIAMSKRLEVLTKIFNESKVRFKKRAFYIRITIVVISALTTIFLGIKSYSFFGVDEKMLSALAFVFSALVPIFSAIEGFFEYKWCWLLCDRVLDDIYMISDDLEYARMIGKPITTEELETFHIRIQAALGEGITEARRKFPLSTIQSETTKGAGLAA
jgi:hypothetical protein